MKKTFVFILTACCLLSMASPSHAFLRKDYRAVEGPVVEKDEKKNQITVKNLSDGEQKVFVGEPGQIASVKKGDTVLILHQMDTNAIGTMVVTQTK